MSATGKIRLIGFKIRDHFKFAPNERICPQWYSIRDTLSDYATGWPKVQASLQQCLNYATLNCPYYKAFAGKPLDTFPVSSKLDFVTHREEILSPEFRNQRTWTSSTSGSTGIPFSVTENMAKRNRLLAELKYFGERGGYPSHERMVYYRASHGGKTAPFWFQFWSNVWQPDAALMDRDNLIKFHAAQAKHSTVAVFGYASSMNSLTWEWTKLGLPPGKHVKLALSSAEVLTPQIRERMQKFWPNARVVSRYANMECGIMAQEYDEPEVFEWNWASYYLEVLKLDSNELAADGEVGRIVITDMFNRAFPMIRYDTGDLGAMIRRKDAYPVLGKLSGRRVDMIYATSGAIASPHAVTNAMWGVENVKQWQFIQEGPKNYRLKYVSDSPAEAEASMRNKFDIIRKTLGEDAEFVFEHLDTFPVQASNKHKMFIQAWKK